MMGLTSGSLAVSRFTAAYRPDPDFESAEFREILPGSEVRESIGFVPFEIDAPYEVGTRRWAFRIRIDRLRPDPTTVKERFKQLVATELASGARFVGPRKKKELRALAEDEILTRTSPRSKILEAVLDGETLYLGTTARSVIGLALQQLRKIGIDARYKNPWIDAGLPELASDAVLAKDPGDSAYGCQFLKALVGDADFLVEPEAGRARLAVAGARIALSGEMLGDLHEYLERGADVLSLKLAHGASSFTLDGPSFRLSGLKLPPEPAGHWTELLDARLAAIAELYETLETKFRQLIQA